jgi:hypothetical protein
VLFSLSPAQLQDKYGKCLVLTCRMPPVLPNVSLRGMSEAVSVAMYASSGRALAELALPPTHNNYWSHIATATSETRSDQLQAELRISLSPRGLHIPDSRARPVSNTTKRKIEAIITAAVQKHERLSPDGQIRRSVPIQECKF